MTRYELLERIGAGRMAEIFRGKAVAAGGFEKPVAIKRIVPELSKDPRFVELLIAEAKILSALRHRNIVQIFDVGVGEDGAYFLVMEYVDGVDLGVLQRGLERRRARLPLDLVLHIGAEVCDALDHAQQTATPDGRPMNLVHRDVSPSNVLVSRAGEVKLTDFGLARRPEDRRTAGGLRGRFAYVSPEQVAGLPVDGRSDVFSLGVVVWELAVGRRLFSGMADYEALRAITDVPIPPPSTQDRALPAALDAILAEALARDVERRLPSAGELGKRLRGLRYSLESSSGDPSTALGRISAGIEREPLSPAALAGSEVAPPAFDSAERSVVKIRTADVFAQRDPDGTGLLEARRLLEAFEEAETRMSSLPVTFDDISSTGGHSLRAIEERTELSAPPIHVGHDTGEVRAGAEPRDTREQSITGELPREAGAVHDTRETDAMEPPTQPAAGAGGSLVETLRGRGAVPVPARGSGGPPVARGPSLVAGPRGTPVETARGGQVAPIPAPGRTARASTSTPTPVRELAPLPVARPARESSPGPGPGRDASAAARPARESSAGRDASAPRLARESSAGRDASGPARPAREPGPGAARPAAGDEAVTSRAPGPRDRAGAARERAASPHEGAAPLRERAASPREGAAPPREGAAPPRSPLPRGEHRLGSDWRERGASAVDSDWTEKTPPPPMPPTDADLAGGASLLGSLSSLPSLAALSAGPSHARPLPGMAEAAPSIHTAATLPPSGARSPFAKPAGEALASAPVDGPGLPAGPAAVQAAPPAPAIIPGASSPAMAGEPASARRSDDVAGDPSRSYPPAASWGWVPPPSPSGPAAVIRRWWPVAVGALAIAILSFVITQAAIDTDLAPVPSAAPADAAEGAVDGGPAPAGAVDAGEAASATDGAGALLALDAADGDAVVADDAGSPIAADGGGAAATGLVLDGGGAAPDLALDGGGAAATGLALDGGAAAGSSIDGGAGAADLVPLDAAAAAPAARPAASPAPPRPARREPSRTRPRSRSRRSR